MGYAGRMMKDLGKKLQSWQGRDEGGKEVAGTVLYSDIGKKYYAKAGWEAFSSAHVALPPNEKPTIEGLPVVKLLKAEDIPALCKIDEGLLRARMEKMPGTKPAVALCPDAATIEWHHAREDFVANELFGKKPVIKGALVGADGQRVWCYWTRVFTNPQKEPPVLHILRLVVEDPNMSSERFTKAIAALFAQAQKQAVEWGMSEVQIWNPNPTTLSGVRLLEGGAKVVEREEESIACLLWFGENKNVDWIECEKFAWC